MNALIDPNLGHMIRGYRLERVLKKDKLTTLYQARTEEIWQPSELTIMLLHIPTILSEHARAQFTERFSREARSLITLRHPSLYPLFGYGQETGRFYLIFPPYPTGLTLARRLQQQKQWSTSEIFSIFAPLSAALDYVHSQGLTYKFFSPANILLQENGPPQLTGIGLAQMLVMQGLDEEIYESEPDKHLKDVTGEYISSPAYLAPEVVKGKSADRHADIYSLGIILFELLSGRPPFTGRTYMETAQKHVRELLPPLHLVAPHIPISLELVINRALHRDPAHRFATAEELITTLAQALNKHPHRPVHFSPTQTITSTQMFPLYTSSEERNHLEYTGVPYSENDGADISASPISTAFNLTTQKDVTDDTPYTNPDTQPLAESSLHNDMDKMAQHIQQMRQRIKGEYHK